MSRPTVVLYDVDGTLVLTGGAGRRSMARAFAEVVGREDALDGISLGGMTDRLILREGLARIGRAFDEAVVRAVFETYLAHLAEELPRSERYRVMPGAREAVDATLAEAAFAVGLGTGNVEPGAKLKLERAGLHETFAFGGYGSDAEDRTELLRVGARRGAAALGVAVDECRVVVVGDTPRDILAAAEMGAECVAVATGSHDERGLREVGRGASVFADLTDPRALRSILGR